MNIRKITEDLEYIYLSPHCAKSRDTKGRKRYERPSSLRTEYQRDRDRIIHCESFRKLKHKTQVFISPRNDFYRTRLTHTIIVSQISRTIAKALRLNEDLTEAIALGHDLGHTPFGHAGEYALNELTGDFRHNIHSLRVVDELEKRKRGLNLTLEVRDGIVKHSKGVSDIIRDIGKKDGPITLEGVVVRISDSIAYINHDIDDAIVSGILKPSQIPGKAKKLIGKKYSERIDNMVIGIVKYSLGKDKIMIPDDIAEGMNVLKDFLYNEIYTHSVIKKPAEKGMTIIYEVWEYFQKNRSHLKKYYEYSEKFTFDENLIDMIASLSDIEMMEFHKKIKIK